MSDRPVLVTGASGFIGQCLVTRLVDPGVPVRCLVRSSSSTAEFNDSLVQLCEGDVLDRQSVRRAADGAEAIFHLAAVVGDWGDPDQFCRVNVDGARNVFESAAELGARVFLASSIVVYGETSHTGVCAEDIEHGTAFAWYVAAIEPDSHHIDLEKRVDVGLAESVEGLIVRWEDPGVELDCSAHG